MVNAVGDGDGDGNGDGDVVYRATYEQSERVYKDKKPGDANADVVGLSSTVNREVGVFPGSGSNGSGRISKSGVEVAD